MPQRLIPLSKRLCHILLYYVLYYSLHKFSAAIDHAAEGIAYLTRVIDTFPEAISLKVCIIFPGHQIIQGTPKGAVYFVDKVLSVEIFLSWLEDEDPSVYSDEGT